MAEDITFSAGVDVAAGIKALEDFAKSGRDVVSALSTVDAALGKNVKESAAVQAGARRTATTYGAIATSAGKYAAAADRISKANVDVEKTQRLVTASVEAGNQAMTRVESTSKKEAATKQRTLAVQNAVYQNALLYAKVQTEQANKLIAQTKAEAAAITVKEKLANAQSRLNDSLNRQASSTPTGTRPAPANAASGASQSSVGPMTKAQYDLTNEGVKATNNLAASQLAVTRAEQRLSTAERELQQAMRGTGDAIQANRFDMYELVVAYGAVTRAGTQLIFNSTKVAAEYEDAFSDLRRVTLDPDGANVKQVQALRGELKDMAAEIGTDFSELSNVASLGAQMGIDADDLENYTDVIAKFASMSKLSADETSLAFGRISNLLHVSSSEYANLASSVAQLAISTVSTEPEILAMTQQIAATGYGAGFTAEQVLGLSATLASLKIPPELARSAFQRIFSDIGTAVNANGEDLENYAKVLGLTAAQSAELYKSDPAGFFNQLVTGIHNATESGQDFYAVMDAIGANDVRDQQLLQRLSGSYEDLGTNVALATDSFDKGTAINDLFAISNQDVMDKVRKLVAELKNLADAFVGPLLPAIAWVIDRLTEFAGWLQTMPGWVKGTVVVVVSFVTALFALKTALALSSIAMRALSSAAAAGGIIKMTKAMYGSMVAAKDDAAAKVDDAAADRVKATSNVQLRESELSLAQAKVTGTAATRTSTAATTGSVGPTTAAAASQEALGAGMVETEVGTRKATGALTKFRGVLVTSGIGLLAIGLGILIDQFADFNSSTDDSASSASQLKDDVDALTETYNSSAGGLDAYNKALSVDTKAWKDSGESARDLEGAFAKIETSVKDVKDGIGTVTKTYTNLLTGNQRIISSGKQMISANQQQNGVLEDQTKILGANVKAWQDKALTETINSLDSKSLNVLNNLGGEAAGLFQKGLDEGFDAVGTQLASRIQAIQFEMNSMDLRDIDPLRMANLDDELKQLQEVQKILLATNDVATKSQLIGSLTGDLGDAGDAADEAATKIDNFTNALKAASDEAFGVADAQGALSKALRDLGASIAENGTSFDVMGEKGAANFSALEKAVSAYGAVLAAQLKNGEISSTDASAGLADYISSLMASLQDQGVDTTQIMGVLQDYVDKFTSTNAELNLGANIDPALEGVDAATNYGDNSRATIGVYADTSAAAAQLNQFLDAAGKVMAGAEAGYRRTLDSLYTQSKSRDARSSANVRPASTGNSARVNTAQLLTAGRNKQIADSYDKASKAGKSAGDVQADAAKRANDELAKQQEYVKDLAEYYANLADTAFAGITSEGGVFKALQNMGLAIQENGTQFNTFTDNGRKNFDALIDTFSSFGKTLQQQVQAGVLTADQATQSYKEFASGVYTELLNLGVPMDQISAFFNSFGVGANGWNSNSQAVMQYADTLTNANKAADAAAEAVGGISTALQQASDYADILSKKFDNLTASLFAIPNATDDIYSSINDLRDSYQDALDKLSDLRTENQKLNDDLAGASVTKNKADIEYEISVRYGETDRAKDYKQQSDEAQTQIDEAQANISANNAQAASIQESIGVTSGYTDEIISNRKALQDLQKTMLDSVLAYAEGGASTEELASYTADLKQQFIEAASASGFSADAIKKYSDAFDGYTDIIRNTPKSVVITATANTSAADAALAALPRFGTYTTNAVVNMKPMLDAINAIPKRGDYTIDPEVDSGSAGSASDDLGGLTNDGEGFDVPLNPSVDDGGWKQSEEQIRKHIDDAWKEGVAGGWVSAKKLTDQVTDSWGKLFGPKTVDIAPNLNQNGWTSVSNSIGVLTSPKVTPISTSNDQASFGITTAALNTVTASRQAVVYPITEGNYYALAWSQLTTLSQNRQTIQYPIVEGSYYNLAWSQLASLSQGRNAVVYPYVDPNAAAATRRNLDNLYLASRGYAAGGQILGFASGGQIPGRAPTNLAKDNLLARGPNGSTVSVQSEEFITQTRAVRYYGLPFMNAVNNMDMPKGIAGFAGGSGNGGSSQGSTPMVMELSPTDRALLQDIKNMDIRLYTTDAEIARSANNGNKSFATRGAR